MIKDVFLKIILILILYALSLADFKDIIIGHPELVIGMEDLEGEDENYIFGNIADLSLDLEENIYVLDDKIGRIQVFNRAGKFLRSIGKKGQGPREFLLPKNFFLKNNRIFIIDIGKVHIFSLKGEFIKSLKIDFDGTDVKVNQKNEIIVLGLRNDKIFHAFNWEGKLLYSFGDPFEIPSKYLNRFIKFKDSPSLKTHIKMYMIDENIYIFHPFEYKLRVYKNNQLLKEFGKDSNDYNIPVATDFGSGGHSIGYIGSPTLIKLNNNILLIFRYIYKKGKEEYQIDIFKEYKFLKSIRSNKLKGRAYAIDSRNRIYCIDPSDYPKIVRYPLILR